MEKAAGIVAIGCLLAAALPFALAAPEESRPEHVPASAWIPMGPDAGFVVTGAATRDAGRDTHTPLTGFLVARRDGNWVRLDVEGGGRVVPAR